MNDLSVDHESLVKLRESVSAASRNIMTAFVWADSDLGHNPWEQFSTTLSALNNALDKQFGPMPAQPAVASDSESVHEAQEHDEVRHYFVRARFKDGHLELKSTHPGSPIYVLSREEIENAAQAAKSLNSFVRVLDL